MEVIGSLLTEMFQGLTAQLGQKCRHFTDKLWFVRLSAMDVRDAEEHLASSARVIAIEAEAQRHAEEVRRRRD